MEIPDFILILCWVALSPLLLLAWIADKLWARVRHQTWARATASGCRMFCDWCEWVDKKLKGD